MTANTNPLTYNGYVSQVANMAVVQTQTVSGVVSGVDDAFNTLVPQMLNYAELRIQRDMDLLPSLATRSYALTSGNNVLTVPVDDFVTVQTIMVNDGAGNTAPLLPASKEFLQNVYGNAAYTAVPQYFAMTGGDAATGGATSNYITVGPYPAANYAISIMGTIRVPSLYQFANATDAGIKSTFISAYLPDLLVQASMIYLSQYQRNFGPALGNDPEMPGSYEVQYQNLLKSALTEEGRKKFSGSAWSSLSVPAAATAGR